MCSVVSSRCWIRRGRHELLLRNRWGNSQLDVVNSLNSRAQHSQPSKWNDKIAPSRFYFSSARRSKTIWVVGSLLSCGAVGIGSVLAYVKFNPHLQNTLKEHVTNIKSVFYSLVGKSIPKSENDAKELKVIEFKKTIGMEKGTLQENPHNQHRINEINIDEAGCLELLQVMYGLKEDISISLKELQDRLEEASDAISVHLGEAIQLVSAVDLGSSDWDELKVKAERRVSTIKSYNAAYGETIAAMKQLEIYLSNLEIKGAKDDILFFKNYLKDSEAKLMDIDNSAVHNLRRTMHSTGEFVSLIEEGWNNLKRELPVLLPDVKFNDKVSNLSKKELDLILSHYEKKAMHLLVTSAFQRSVQNELLLEELEKNRAKSGLTSELNVEENLRYQKKIINILHQKELSELKASHEAELEREFKKQAVAYAEHLKETLKVLEASIFDKYYVQLQEGLRQEKFDYHRELAKILGHLKGVEESLRARMELEMASRKSHALWVACQNLSSSINREHNFSTEHGIQLIILGAQIEAIKTISGGDPFVANVLCSLPEEAISRGIFTKEALKLRFSQVEKMCKNVALIGHSGGSLFQYFLSYLQSFMLIKSSSDAFKTEELIDVDSLSTLEILSRARASVNKENFEQALKYMNLLVGGPTEVARDWVHDVRLYLEVSQAANALLSYACAVDIKAYA